ncbi:hypothetical protein PTT_00641 [Pyrenophora teres f. teres 0-1]|uniref:Uncharacterized protein n=1 Tax=Pyrenophora teres f. teres (strain 0-1) TaxID=861557 RepID=E3RCM5_PYRTT|nr:hypothetical protein PTT_00641 [Pyrenophora teres f. teres 0-1]
MPLSDTTADTDPTSLACAVTKISPKSATDRVSGGARAARTEIPSRSYPKGVQPVTQGSISR